MGFFATHGGDGEVPKSRLFYLGLTMPGSVAAKVNSGAQTVTPGSMYGISPGSVLTVQDTFTTKVAVAPVSPTAGVSMTLTTGDGIKCPPTPFYMNIWDSAATMVVPFVETVQVTTVLGDVLTIVRGIVGSRSVIVGDSVVVCLATGLTNAESITISGTSSTQFTATFANPHAASWTFAVPIPVYWTDFDIDIVTGGGDPCGAHTWTAMPITESQVQHQPDGDTGAFKIGDADGLLFPVLAANNGGEMSPAAIYEAGFLTTNVTATPDEVIQIFSGLIDRCTVATANEDNIVIVLMPPVQQNSGRLPLRLASSLVRVT